ncbi:MAG: AAA family ATPase, partial [Cyanobacteriota bacterium]
MSNQNILSWGDVSYAARNICTSLDHELGAVEWIWDAWEILIQSGLVTYSTKTEYCEVVIRFMALVGFYLECCEDYSFDWEEYVEANCLEWVEDFKLRHSYIKQIIEPTFNRNFNEDEDEVKTSELLYLVNNAHKEVYRLLIEGFGSESMLFGSIWQSQQPETQQLEIDEEYEFYETEAELVSDAILGKKMEILAKIYEQANVTTINGDIDQITFPAKQIAHQIAAWAKIYEQVNATEINEDIDKVAFAAKQLAHFFNGEIITIINDETIRKFKESREMTPTENSECPFSSYSFELLMKWHNKYHLNPAEIIGSDEYDEFIEYVEQPFIQLCQLVAARLPVCLTARTVNDGYIYGDIMKEIIVNSNKNYDNKILSLQEYFSPFSLLYIRINPYSLAFGYVIKTYSELFLQGQQKNLKSLLEIISDNPTLLIKDKNEIVITKREVLQQSTEELVNKISQTFRSYLPLVLLTLSNEPIPVISQYLNNLNNEYSLKQFTEETSIEKIEIKRWVHAIERKKQAIFYGSPGTGKTFITQKIAQHLIGGGYGFSELVQFHPAYTYEDFIQGIRPQSQDGQLKYSLVPGRFLEFCKKAEYCQGLCVLIIDEINRANLAQVFGELMYLLEYRDKEIPLAGGTAFRIPLNVRIIGTMNTADRSIALVDHALRRRFAFIELRPNYEVLRRYHEKKTSFKVNKLIDVLKRLNNAIADKHYEIGISFFLTEKLPEDIEDIWLMEIEPYLEEYFFDNLKKV